MRWVRYNPNPIKNNAGDCVVRMMTLAANESWEESYSRLALKGLEMGDMPSANIVWMEILEELGFKRYNLPSFCPNCYTFDDFCREHPEGLFVLGTGTHVATVCNGKLYDSWNSSFEVPIMVFKQVDYERED